MDIKLLYHGGKSLDIDSIIAYGLNESRQFFMTPNIILAREASYHHPDGKLLVVRISGLVYDKAKEEGCFEERPYLGIIQVESCLEVRIKPGEGIRVLNRCLREFYPH